MKRRVIVGIVGLLTLVLVSVIPAWAQFNQGGNDNETHMWIEPLGKKSGAAILHVDNLKAVYLNTPPPDGTAVEFSGGDVSGKGWVWIVNFDDNPFLEKTSVHVWTGVGPDWGVYAEGFVRDGGSDILITAGVRKKKLTFALTHALRNTCSGDFYAWASHPVEGRHLISCPGLPNPDMLTILTAPKKGGSIRFATDEEVAEFAEYYATICQGWRNPFPPF